MTGGLRLHDLRPGPEEGEGISLDLPPAATGFLMGGPGAGKSALLERIAGLSPALGGSVAFGGRTLAPGDIAARTRAGVVLVPRDPPVVDGLKVGQHLQLVGGRLQQDVAGLIEAVAPELWGLWKKRAGTLSHAERRLLDLGRALAMRPRLLLLDELALDIGIERMAGIVALLRAQGIGLLVAERYRAAGLALADRAWLLVHGRIVLEGPGSALMASDRVLAACVGDHGEPEA